ncbi:MAG: hypothetical protein ACLPWF_29990 [Bryobacteraceae bacterium]
MLQLLVLPMRRNEPVRETLQTLLQGADGAVRPLPGIGFSGLVLGKLIL